MKKSKTKHHYIFIFLLIIAAIFFLYEEFGKEKKPKVTPRITKPDKKSEMVLPKPSRPKAAIIIDDLGSNKNAAKEVLDLKIPVTLSILPQQTYSAWVAEEGHRLEHDIIAHIPMEAEKSYKLGEGGLYIWMTDKEIAETLNKDILSIPHALGVSNHMGSAFTQDERAMQVLISELKKKKLFFLDSLTSPKSVGFNLARMQGITALNRDIFLDDKDDPSEIEAQWRKLIKIADKNGYAILLAHPRKNTIEFLQKTLQNNNQVAVVPISELVR
ncbi:MAG: divergent polysaccharide deacetylase family protein [Nitrospirae bacterium]|nr:divergent polysaccharide deacetylase family protein [Nitrospirota bacterium]